ncbi:MAG TPA: hypothetical protein VM451_06690 [Candidatus Limnocylindria bacterium]|nr:hypothetical protein [Candidatus Limnocylindria bacterium]
MERRVAPLAALLVVLSLGGVALARTSSPAPAALGAVTWPVSTLLVSEVQTGGASASDEFAEITNVGATAVDLNGLELVYATSTGTTVTRKASWSASLPLGSGKHLLVANSAGIYAALADATYSSGFAATGGAVVLRVIGGAPIDAVGWGDATSTFVEGTPVVAPAAGASIERKPGGINGNTVDTNANSLDWTAQATPNPQNLAAPPVPAPTATSTPTLTPAPTAVPSPTPTATTAPSSPPDPSLSPSPSPSPAVTIEPTTAPTAEPTATLAPTFGPTFEPTPDPTTTPIPSPVPTPVSTPAPIETLAPTPDPTLTPTPVPTTTPIPTVTIEAARAQANGTTARIGGVLTTHLGALESARKAFIQDDSAGIALYLDAAVLAGLPADTRIEVSGTLDDRFAERTLRVAELDIVSFGPQQRPAPWALPTGEILEAVEGLRVMVHGLTVGSPTNLSDGLGLMVDDGSGAVRVIVSSEALGGLSVPSGTNVIAVGPVGQRDSSGTGLAGYRVHATEESDFGILPAPTPSPTATPAPTSSPGPTATPAPTPAPSATAKPTAAPTPTASAAPSPTPAPTRTPSPTPMPTATPGPTLPGSISVVEARGAAIGTVVTISGVVTAEGGRLGLPPLIAVADGTGGIAVRVPDGTATPARGAIVVVKGALADPYGQLELRPSAAGFKVTGSGSLPAPVRLTAAQLGEATEGRLVELTGAVAATPAKSTSGDITIELTDQGGATFRVLADASSGVAATDLVKGRSYRLAGIVGQRASRKGALDGYRLYLRDKADIESVAGPTTPGASGSPTSVRPVSTALALPEGSIVTIEAIVTAGVSLLDSSGRRIVVQDSSGAIEVLLPSGTAAPSVGSHLRITGKTGRAWGASRIGATTVDSIGGGSAITPASLNRAPAERDEWLLVRLAGSISKVERLGDHWRADVTLADGSKAAVIGQAGAAIPSTAIIIGRRITVVGVVRRPYPTASDRRFAVLPRNGSDVAVGPAGNGAPGEGLGASGAGSNGGADPSPAANSIDITPDTDLAALSEHVGQRVRVGGLIARLAEDGFDLDDGTALARVQLRDDMTALLAHLREGEAVAATGVVELVDGVTAVVVGSDGALLRVGSLGQALPIGGLPSEPAATEDPAEGAATLADATGLTPNLAPTSLLALAMITALSVLMTVARRRLARRHLRTALVARLTTLRAKEG